MKLFDLCGSVVGFMYNGRRTYHSITGGILSIVLLIGILAIIGAYLDSFFRRDKPKMTFEDLKYYAPPSLQLTDDFSFVVMTRYGRENAIKNNIVKVEATYQMMNGTEWTSRQLDSIPCQSSNPNLQVQFTKLELAKGACFNISGLSLQGSKVTDILKYLQIQFVLCLNESHCVPEQDIIDLFYKTRPVAILYFIDSAFNSYNKAKRVEQFYNSFDINLTYQNNKESLISFSYNSLFVDEQYIQTGKATNYSSFMLSSFQDRGQIRMSQEATILTLNLMSSNFKSIIYVSYMQLFELLANICSLLNILIIIICSIGKYFNHYFFQSDLINSLFESEMALEILNGESSKSLSNFKEKCNKRSLVKTPLERTKVTANNFIIEKTIFPHANRSTNIHLNQTNQSLIPVNSPSQLKNRQSRKEHNEFNYISITKMLFMSMIPCYINKKHQDFKAKFNQISHALTFYQDLRNVYRKLMEIDLLKYLLLTEKQLALYKIVPKPQFDRLNKGIKSSQSDFASLITDPNFHFLKSKKTIEKALSNSVNKELSAFKQTQGGNEDKLYEKLLRLVNQPLSNESYII